MRLKVPKMLIMLIFMCLLFACEKEYIYYKDPNYMYVMNNSTKVYHLKSCRFVKTIKQKNYQDGNYSQIPNHYKRCETSKHKLYTIN